MLPLPAPLHIRDSLLTTRQINQIQPRQSNIILALGLFPVRDCCRTGNGRIARAGLDNDGEYAMRAGRAVVLLHQHYNPDGVIMFPLTLQYAGCDDGGKGKGEGKGTHK